jgi:hypothetical protein
MGFAKRRERLGLFWVLFYIARHYRTGLWASLARPPTIGAAGYRKALKKG